MAGSFFDSPRKSRGVSGGTWRRLKTHVNRQGKAVKKAAEDQGKGPQYKVRGEQNQEESSGEKRDKEKTAPKEEREERHGGERREWRQGGDYKAVQRKRRETRKRLHQKRRDESETRGE